MTVTLTQRELQVLHLLSTGLQHQDAAHRLGIAPSTVKRHSKHILHKLDAGNMAHAVAIALRRGVMQ